MDVQNFINKIISKNAIIEKPLLGGMMNESFIINNEGKRYVLFISTDQANEMVDRVLEKEHQKIVYDLGITSKNVYFDTVKGIKIHEYIEGISIDKCETYDLDKVAVLLQKLHSSKTLSKLDYQPFVRFIDYEAQALKFSDLTDAVFVEGKALLMKNKQFLESIPKVLCHNDAQRSNIVKGIDDRYYLIDFEFVGNNDPIYDIATFGNGSVEEGFTLLNAYFKSPTLEEKQRYYLWRTYISLQWYLVALVKHYRGEGKIHNIDFLSVANHFINNAKSSINYYKEIK